MTRNVFLSSLEVVTQKVTELLAFAPEGSECVRNIGRSAIVEVARRIEDIMLHDAVRQICLAQSLTDEESTSLAKCLLTERPPLLRQMRYHTEEEIAQGLRQAYKQTLSQARKAVANDTVRAAPAINITADNEGGEWVVPIWCLSALFLLARERLAETLRRRYSVNSHLAQQFARSASQSVVLEFARAAPERLTGHALVRNLSHQGLLDARLLAHAIVRGQFQIFHEAMSLLSGAPRDEVERLFADEHHSARRQFLNDVISSRFALLLLHAWEAAKKNDHLLRSGDRSEFMASTISELNQFLIVSDRIEPEVHDIVLNLHDAEIVEFVLPKLPSKAEIIAFPSAATWRHREKAAEAV